jgi:hypothetical protein
MRRRNFLAALVALPFASKVLESSAVRHSEKGVRIPLNVTTAYSGSWTVVTLTLPDGGRESTLTLSQS